MSKSKKTKFEPGIYNYCDRWCEKCQKTDRCLLFSKNQENGADLLAMGIDPDSTDGAMMMVKMSFDETFSLIGKICEEQRINPEMTEEENRKYELFDQQTDPKGLKLYKEAECLQREIFKWLASVPSLDINAYREAYDNVAWHHSLIFAKTARTLRSYLEYQHEDEETRQYSLDDAIKSGWVAFRSTTICRDSFELMDDYVKDPRISKIAKKCSAHMSELQKHLDNISKTG